MSCLKSGSEGDLQQQQQQHQHLIDERKRKRIESNRESARRSRMKKQNHLDNLTAQMIQLKKENENFVTNINIATQNYLNIEAENCVLRAQMMELSQRLNSLNNILDYMNSRNGNILEAAAMEISQQANNDCFINNSFNFMYLNQPIIASADLFQYY